MNNSLLTNNYWNLLNNGAHICSIYRTNEELFNSVIPFFSEGIIKHQICLYIFDENSPENVNEELEKIWPIPNHIKNISDMQIKSQKDLYTKNGIFDSDKMISQIKETIQDTIKEGFTGLRAAAEMSWMITNETPMQTVVDYEMRLNTLFPTEKLIGICQYHEEKFSKDLLINIIRTHPYVMLYGKLYENKYLYTNPQYNTGLKNHFKSSDYDTILSMFLDELPFGAM